jgi:pantoate--beta-alanine ligase
MVRDLDWPIEIVAVPTVREPDGLAMSSRNAYLKPGDRARAVVLNHALRSAQTAWQGGETRATAIEGRMREELRREPEVSVEYIAIAEPEMLAPVAAVDVTTVVAIAARIGGTRLIDNVTLGEGIG